MAAFAIATVAIPLLRTELYPFSNPSLFSDAPRVFCTYTVTDPEGRRLSPAAFGLALRYFGLDGFRADRPGPHPGALAVPPTVNLFGAVGAPEVVVPAVEHGLRARPDLAWVDVVQRAWGPVDASRVGLLATRTWRVANPHRTAAR